MRGRLRNVLPLEDHSPGIGWEVPANQIEKSGFSSTVGPDDGVQVALLHLQADPVHCHEPAEGFSQSFCLKNHLCVPTQCYRAPLRGAVSTSRPVTAVATC